MLSTTSLKSLTSVLLLSVLLVVVQGEHDAALEKAVNWLLSERQADWGWGGMPTAYALIAMQVSKIGDRSHRELTAKQLEIDLVLQLWRHEKPRLTSAQLAIYSLALSSSCQDPRQFHGIDLIGSLLHHSEPDSDSEFALCSLAMCSAGSHVRRRQWRRLVNIASTGRNVESLSGAVIALKCIVRDHRNRNLQHYLEEPIKALASSQQPDGSFGNAYNTALAIHALQDDTSWNKTSALKWLLNQQSNDGSFTDVPTTSHVIMTLSKKGIGFIKDTDCDKSNLEEVESGISIVPHVVNEEKSKVQNTYEKNTTSSVEKLMKQGNSPSKSNSSEGLSVTYTLWVGTNITESHTITMNVPDNLTFYNVMQLAAEQNNDFVFAAADYPNGHYVHTVAGCKEEPMSYHYWLLYRLPDLPDQINPPGNQWVAPGGVDELTVKDGDHYLFWYKKL